MNITDKIVKLQAQSESEDALGNEAAALAFGAAAQRLMLEHDIEDADLEAHKRAGTQRVEEPVEEHDLKLHLLGIASSRKRNAALEDLVMFVGRAHLCKMLIKPGSNWVGLVGTARHVQVAELVIGMMWKAQTKLAAAGLRAAKQEGADIHNYTRTFRNAFVCRLAVRYREEQHAVAAEHAVTVGHDISTNTELERQTIEAGETSTALMVVNRELERVGSYISRHYKGKSARSIGSYGGYNTRAQGDGQRAANSVPLRSNAVSASTRGQLQA